MLFDTHIHLDRFPPEFGLEQEIAAARKAGVSTFLVPGVSRAGWSGIAEVVAETEGAWPAYGLHPMAATEWDDDCRTELAKYLQSPATVAVGEIGLDRYIDIPMARQEESFRQQLQLATEYGLPVLIHCRKMPGRILEILQEEYTGGAGGIMHAFSGSLESAKVLISLGFVLSFGGALTYPEAKQGVEVLRKLPEDAIVIETDAPDLAPHPHRGEMNRPVWLIQVLERLAEIRGWSLDEAAALTTANARRVLRLKG